MNPKLIQAIRERIKAGQNKAEIQTEVMGFDYEEVAFLAAYEEAFSASTIPKPIPVPQANTTPVRDTSLVIGKDTVLTLLGYKELLLSGLHLAQNNLPLLGKGVIFTVLAGVLFGGGALALFGAGAYFGEAGFFVSVGLFILWALLFMLVVSACLTSVLRGLLKRDSGERYRSHIRWTFLHVIGILLVGFYVNIFSQLGYSLLIVPGIIFSIYSFFAVMYVVSGESKGLAALTKSIALVHGRFWDVLGRILASVLVILVLVIVTLGISSLSILINPFLFPLILVPSLIWIIYWHTCFSVVLFESLKVLPKKAELTIKESTLINVFRVVIGIVITGMVLLGVMLGYGFVTLMGDDHTYSSGKWSIKDVSVDMAKKTSLRILSDQMESYKEENDSYAGACEEIEGGSSCVSDEATYLLEIPLSKGFYCIDNTGYNEVTRRSSIIFGVCDREAAEEVDEEEKVESTSTEAAVVETEQIN